MTILLKTFLAASLALGAGAATPVRVMTYNIRNSSKDSESPGLNWDARKEDFANMIEKSAPDVFGLQEVLPEQMEFLRGRFPEYTFVGEFRNKDRASGEASPVVFRKARFSAVKSGTFWLSETPDEPGSISWHAAYPRICSYAVLRDRHTGKRFCFANAHTDHRSEEAGEKGAILIIERMKEFGDGSPIILAGDFNCLENEKPAVAVAAMLNDALYISETPPEGSWRTFNGWRWREKELSIAEALKLAVAGRTAHGGKRIDYIYVSPGIRVLSYRTRPDARPGVRLYPSDHFPTVAEIAIE